MRKLQKNTRIFNSIFLSQLLLFTSALFAPIAQSSVPDEIPTALIATAASGQASLSWTAPATTTDLIGYRVEVSSDSGNTYQAADGPCGPTTTEISLDTSCLATDLINGTAYIFTVRALYSDSRSTDFSAPSSEVTPQASVPSAPTISSAISADRSLVIKFSNPLSNGGSAITGYEYSVDGGASWQSAMANVIVSPLVIRGLTNDQSYDIKIRALNVSGAGDASNQVSAIPQDKNYVLDNTLIRIGSGSQESIARDHGNLRQPWYKRDGTYFKLTFSSRDLEYAVGLNGSATSTGTVGNAGTPVWNTNGNILYTGQSPTYTDGTIFAENWNQIASSGNLSTGYGKLTFIGNVSIQSGDDIQTLRVTHSYELKVGENFLKITTKVENLSAVAVPNVRMWVGTGDDYVGTIDGPSKKRGTLSSNGFTENSDEKDAAPALLVYNQNDAVLFYSTTQSTTSVSNCCSYSNAVLANPYTNATHWLGEADGTWHDGSYTLYVNAGDLGVAQSLSFDWFYAAGSTDVINDIARDVSAASVSAPQTEAGDSSITLRWEEPDTDDPITNYKFRYSSDGGTSWTEIVRDPASNSPLFETITGLTPGVSYLFQIMPITSAGDGEWSDSSVATTASGPNAPVVNSVTGGPQSLSIDFDPPTSYTGMESITAYEYSTDRGATWQTINSTTSPLVITSISSDPTQRLQNGVNYQVSLRAVNFYGSGLITTQGGMPVDVPSAPNNVSVVSGFQSARVIFENANANGSAITSYEYSLDGGTTWISPSPTLTASPLVLRDLVNGTNYSVQVRAINEIGNGSASASVTFTPGVIDYVWYALTSSSTSPITNTVFVVRTAPNGDVYIGGSFENAAGIDNADYIAKWDGTNWSALGGVEDGALECGSGSGSCGVFAIEFDSNSNPIIAGRFQIKDNSAGKYVARWDGTDWQSLGADAALNDSARDLASDSQGNLYIAGLFTNAAGISGANYIARWNGSEWSAVGAPNSISSRSLALAVGKNDAIYLGGQFSNSGGVGANYVVKWYQNNWHALAGLDDYVMTLAVDTSGSDDVVYAGGGFQNVGGNSNADYLAVYSSGTWSGLSNQIRLDNFVRDLAITPTGGLLVAGFFDDRQNDLISGLGLWENNQWISVGDSSNDGTGDSSPFSSRLETVTLGKDGRIYAGGYFSNAAGVPEADYVAMTNAIARFSTQVPSPSRPGGGSSGGNSTSSPDPNPSPTPLIRPNRTQPNPSTQNLPEEITPVPDGVRPQPIAGSPERRAPLVQIMIDQILNVLRPVAFDFLQEIINRAINEIQERFALLGDGILEETVALSKINSETKKPLDLISAVLVNGKAEPSRLILVDKSELHVVTGDGSLLKLEARSNMAPIPVDSLGRLQLVRGNKVNSDGIGFKADNEFAVWLFSEPILIGVGKTDLAGRIFSEFLVNDELPLGEHTLQLNGIDQNQNQRSISVPVVVVEDMETAMQQAMPETILVEQNPVQSWISSINYLIVLLLLLIAIALWVIWRTRRDQEENELDPKDTQELSLAPVLIEPNRNIVSKEEFKIESAVKLTPAAKARPTATPKPVAKSTSLKKSKTTSSKPKTRVKSR
jgi:hypothetical protein